MEVQIQEPLLPTLCASFTGLPFGAVKITRIPATWVAIQMKQDSECTSAEHATRTVLHSSCWLLYNL